MLAIWLIATGVLPLLARIIHGRVGGARKPLRMLRCANRPKTGCRVHEGLTPCVTHHFHSGSLHAPYSL